MMPLRRTVAPIAIGAFALALTACSPADGPGPSAPAAPGVASTRPAPSVPAIVSAPPSETAVIGEVPAEILDLVLADARERLDTDNPMVLVGEAVTWPDGSLGCPEPGMMYTQALVDGYHIVVTQGAAELDYRVGEGGGFRICTAPRPGG